MVCCVQRGATEPRRLANERGARRLLKCLELTRERGVAPAGDGASDLPTERISVTMICGFHDEPASADAPQHGPVRVQYRTQSSNTAVDFFRFVANAIAVRYLVRGDILILDSDSLEMSIELNELLENCGIAVVYMPACSPELNPWYGAWRRPPRTHTNRAHSDFLLSIGAQRICVC